MSGKISEIRKSPDRRFRGGGMKGKIFIWLVMFLLSACLISGTETVFWEVKTKSQFLAGKCDGTGITAAGGLTLAPELKVLFHAGDVHIWSIIPGKEGELIAGTGDEGKVFQINAEGESEILLQAKEYEIYAVTRSKKGDIYMASSPKGKILRVDPKGTKSVFATLDATYIWSMVHDGQYLYAATGGEAGIIFRITGDGTAERFFTCEDQNITALLLKKNGNLLAGTAFEGMLYEVFKDGQGRVIFDSPLNEITAIVQGRDESYFFAAVGFTARRPVSAQEQIRAQQRLPGAVEQNNGFSLQTPLALQGPPETVISESRILRPEDRKEPLRGDIHQLTGDDTLRKIWSNEKIGVFSLVALPDGYILAGTDDRGRILRIGETGKESLYISTGEGRITAILPVGEKGRIFGAASNPGRLFTLERRKQGEGRYFSEVHDAGNLAQWGRIRWKAPGKAADKILLFARSGNARTPGENWSEWQGPLLQEMQIGLPRARFVQWKAVLPASETALDAILNSVTISYRQINLAPVIRSVSFLSPGEHFLPSGNKQDQTFQSAIDRLVRRSANSEKKGPERRDTPARREYLQGLQTILWEAEDPNQDRLLFNLKLSRSGDSNWFLPGEGLEDLHFTLDTRKLPDGEYRVILEASDSPSNREEEAFTVEELSDPFLIDNTPPVIEIVESTKDQIRVKVTDAYSVIKIAEYSLDAGPWEPLHPADGLFDDRSESFTIPIHGSSKEKRVLVISVMDTRKNISSKTVKFP